MLNLACISITLDDWYHQAKTEKRLEPTINAIACVFDSTFGCCNCNKRFPTAILTVNLLFAAVASEGA